MAAHIPLDRPCGECDYCSSPKWDLESHPTTFRAVSNSPVDGINFKYSHFTANQIADAFANLIPGHMDWQIKTSALERWNTLLPLLVEEPKLRECEFDLQPIYRILDDFLFLRALQDICAVEWVDGRLRVRAAAQDTANLYLKGSDEPFLLSHRREPDVRIEAEARVQLLEGMYKRIPKRNNTVEREKKAHREEKRAAERKNTPENDQKKANDDETWACVCAMFARWENVAGTSSEGQPESGGRLAGRMAIEEVKAGDDCFRDGKNDDGWKEEDSG